MTSKIFTCFHEIMFYLLCVCVCVCVACLADIVYVLDTSGSINAANPDNYRLMQNFINLVIQNLEFGVNGAYHGLVQFGNLAYNRFFLGTFTNKQDLVDGVAQVAYFTDNQQTNTQSALNKMTYDQFQLAMGDRPNVPNYAIVLTDGRSNVFPENTVPTAQLAKDQGTYIYAIGIGPDTDINELRDISSPPQQFNISWSSLPTFDLLRSQVSTVVNRICQGEMNEMLINE